MLKLKINSGLMSKWLLKRLFMLVQREEKNTTNSWLLLREGSKTGCLEAAKE